MYGHVIDGEVNSIGLPAVWVSDDGKTIFGFNTLSDDELKKHNWYPVVVNLEDDSVPESNHMISKVEFSEGVITIHKSLNKPSDEGVKNPELVIKSLMGQIKEMEQVIDDHNKRAAITNFALAQLDSKLIELSDKYESLDDKDNK